MINHDNIHTQFLYRLFISEKHFVHILTKNLHVIRLSETTHYNSCCIALYTFPFRLKIQSFLYLSTLQHVMITLPVLSLSRPAGCCCCRNPLPPTCRSIRIWCSMIQNAGLIWCYRLVATIHHYGVHDDQNISILILYKSFTIKQVHYLNDEL